MNPPSTAELRQAVAADIRAGMGRHRVTQAALAKKIGCSRVALSERLNGHRAFNTDQLLTIAAALDLDLVELLAGADTSAGVA